MTDLFNPDFVFWINKLGYVWLQFFENFFVLKSKENKENMKNTFVLFLFFLIMKNTENTKFRKQEQFSEKTNPVWFLFLKTVIENTENTILVFSENSCFCSPNLVFYVCSLCF